MMNRNLVRFAIIQICSCDKHFLTSSYRLGNIIGCLIVVRKTWITLLNLSINIMTTIIDGVWNKRKIQKDMSEWGWLTKMQEENSGQPLLKKPYYENCPGCKVDRDKELKTDVSILNLSYIWMATLCGSKHWLNWTVSHFCMCSKKTNSSGLIFSAKFANATSTVAFTLFCLNMLTPHVSI